jgi:hypothetical protein
MRAATLLTMRIVIGTRGMNLIIRIPGAGRSTNLRKKTLNLSLRAMREQRLLQRGRMTPTQKPYTSLA